MDSSIDGKNIRQKFCRVRNRVERFQGDCLLTCRSTVTRDSLLALASQYKNTIRLGCSRSVIKQKALSLQKSLQTFHPSKPLDAPKMVHFAPKRNARYTSGIPFPTQLSVFTPTPRVCTGGWSYTDVRTEIFSDPIFRSVGGREPHSMRSCSQ